MQKRQESSKWFCGCSMSETESKNIPGSCPRFYEANSMPKNGQLNQNHQCKKKNKNTNRPARIQMTCRPRSCQKRKIFKKCKPSTSVYMRSVISETRSIKTKKYESLMPHSLILKQEVGEERVINSEGSRIAKIKLESQKNPQGVVGSADLGISKLKRHRSEDATADKPEAGPSKIDFEKPEDLIDLTEDEIRDITDPGWNRFRSLKSEKEKFLDSLNLWNAQNLNPSLNLTHYGYLRLKQPNVKKEKLDEKDAEDRRGSGEGPSHRYVEPTEQIVKREGEQIVKREAEQIVKKEAEQIVKKEAEQIVKREAKQIVKKEAEQIVKQEAEQIVKREAEQIVKREAEQIVKREADQIVKREAEQIVKQEADQIVKREADQIVKKEAKQIVKKEAEQIVKREADQIVMREAEQIVKQEADQIVKKEAEQSSAETSNESDENREPVRKKCKLEEFPIERFETYRRLEDPVKAMSKKQCPPDSVSTIIMKAKQEMDNFYVFFRKIFSVNILTTLPEEEMKEMENSFLYSYFLYQK